MKAAPSVYLNKFNCPRCAAYSRQSWQNVYVENTSDTPKPWRSTFGKDKAEVALEKIKSIQDGTFEGAPLYYETDDEFYDLCIREKSPIVTDSMKEHYVIAVDNLFISQCDACSMCAVWVGGDLLIPNFSHDITAPDDLQEKAREYFLEAVSIKSKSPRAAAAMLRLCIEELCVDLCIKKGLFDPNAKKPTLDDMIGLLEQEGLNSRVINALDIVRVIGNDAIHGGKINLNDDTNIVASLFKIIDMICTQMIVEPRQEQELYEILPASKKVGIAQRKAKFNVSQTVAEEIRIPDSLDKKCD